MILKEAFRHQNYLETILNAVKAYLSIPTNVTQITQEHYRSRTNPDANDEIIVMPKSTVFEDDSINVNTVIDFMIDVLNEKEKLTAAIADAKRTCELDIDSSVSLNKTRQSIAEILRSMSNIKSSQKDSTAFGNKFNADGEQVRYLYDIKVITTIDFDRNKTKALEKKLNTISDDISNKLDMVNISTDVKYITKYELGDSLEDCIKVFLNK